MFAAFLVWAVAVVFLRPPAAPSLPPFDPVVAHAAWKEQVATEIGVLNEHSPTEEIRRIQQDLLTIRVTAEDRDAHLELIMALSAFARGDAGSYARLQTAFAATQR